jgi:hypothetical protein
MELPVCTLSSTVLSFDFKPVRALPIAIFMRGWVRYAGVGLPIRQGFAKDFGGRLRMRRVAVVRPGSLCLPVATIRRGEPER